VSEPSPFEVEIAIARLQKYKSPEKNQILAEPIQAGGEISQSEIHILIIWSKEEWPNQQKESYYFISSQAG
jgi:hypothetical protein